MTGPFGAERRQVAELAAKLRQDREDFARHSSALRSRFLGRLASPAGLLACFVAGAALAPATRGALRLAISGRALRGLALEATRLLQAWRDGRAPRPGSTRKTS